LQGSYYVCPLRLKLEIIKIDRFHTLYIQNIAYLRFGLELAENIWEMLADWNGDYLPEDQVNPTGPGTGGRKVARGGSWYASPDHVRSALRTHLGIDQQFNHAGFCCVKSIP
jgi:hypothetical protein